MYRDAGLRRLLAELQACLRDCLHPWARPLAWVLRTRLVLPCPLPAGIHGFTLPPLPVILVNARWLKQNLSAKDSSIQGSYFEHAEACAIAQLLLHESAHQLLAVWPEWKRWLGLRPVYGASINAADAISEAVCRELCARSRYAGQPVSYRSPLAWLHPVFRR